MGEQLEWPKKKQLEATMRTIHPSDPQAVPASEPPQNGHSSSAGTCLAGHGPDHVAHSRAWIPLFAPVVATVILALTVWFQGRQLSVTRDANEDVQFRDALKTVAQARGTPGEFTALVLLKPFLNSPQHGDTARQLITSVLPEVQGYDTFEDLLVALFPDPARADADSLARIARAQQRRLHELDHRLEHLRNDPSQESSAKVAVEEDVIGHQRDERLQQIVLVNKLLVQAIAMRSGNARLLDLKQVLFYQTDMSNRPLTRLDISDAKFEAVNVKGAELAGILGFEGSNWQGTAWWRARYLDKALLQYLAQNFPYQKNQEYPGEKALSSQDYELNLKRLQTAPAPATSETAPWTDGPPETT